MPGVPPPGSRLNLLGFSGGDGVARPRDPTLFLLFGETLYLMSGSLFQVVLPTALAGVFRVRGEGSRPP